MVKTVNLTISLSEIPEVYVILTKSPIVIPLKNNNREYRIITGGPRWNGERMNALRKFITAFWLMLIILQPAWVPGKASSALSQLPSLTESDQDWPQAGHDAQRTNVSTVEVDPPYCYAWKWYEAPFASRTQPVISSGRLFIGSMEGTLFARDATTGSPLWRYETSSPIRNSAAVYGGTVVIFTTHAGFTYGLSATGGNLLWKIETGSSSTAPLIDPASGRVYVASSSGKLTALNAQDGSKVWEYQSSAPILTSPALSSDGQLLFGGNEAVQAFALRASDGSPVWTSTLQGQSLADRYPVVMGDSVYYRSQPLYFFHVLLQEGDDIMNQAGSWTTSFSLSAWTADWANVKAKILNYLTAQPAKQTFFALRTSDGSSRGVVPELFTGGTNDVPAPPIVKGTSVYLPYRARHGIQTDSGTVHVMTKYDAELGRLDSASLDITPLTSNKKLAGMLEFRMTSDEPSMLTMGGNILWVDNWERLGGLNVQTGDIIEGGAVSNDWPECYGQCGPGTAMPFFPMSGSGAAYPFPSPRVKEGNLRGGAVIANNQVYWRVIEGGMAAFAHRSGSTCPAPKVWGPVNPPAAPPTVTATPRALEDYLTLELTQPVSNPPAKLITRLRSEVSSLVASGKHWMPFYLERGFSNTRVFPYNTDKDQRPPVIEYASHGNAYFHDPGDLLISMAMAYPYLDATLQSQVRTYMTAEMGRFPPYTAMPYSASGDKDWLKQGAARELYSVPMRAQLNNWPPVAASLNALYGLWLWSKNTGDWSYVQSHYSDIRGLFLSRTPMNHTSGKMDYASDLAGVIGFYRMATYLGKTSDVSQARTVALTAMADLRDNFSQYAQRADTEYFDPPSFTKGIYAPALFGLTPEVGLFLREQTNGAASKYLNDKEYGTNGNGLRWWYITRVGSHSEPGESSYLAPTAGWSHFMAHAYLVGDKQDALMTWLDRPWGKADLSSIQKVVATIQAAPVAPDLSGCKINATPSAVLSNKPINYLIDIRNSGLTISDTIHVEDVLPSGLTFVSNSTQVSPATGTIAVNGQTLTWDGVLPSNGSLTINFKATSNVPLNQTMAITDTVRIQAPGLSEVLRSVKVIVNPKSTYIPVIKN
jgi:uncharacterized repeat protein (TIGR01451 family)